MGVEFNEFNYKRNDGGEKLTGTARLLMKLSGGAIKNQQQANVVTLILTVLIFAASIYLFING